MLNWLLNLEPECPSLLASSVLTPNQGLHVTVRISYTVHLTTPFLGLRVLICKVSQQEYLSFKLKTTLSSVKKSGIYLG